VVLFASPALPHLAPSRPRSALLAEQGYAVLRRDDGALYAALDYGHSGAGHGHPDRLNFVLVRGIDRWLDDVGTGGLDLTWSNPPGANPGVNIRIEVNDTEVTTVPGSSTSASIPSSAFPAGQVSTVEVINSSQIASRCSYPPGVNTSGFIKNWLLLGPLERPGGPAPGDDQIILDFLTDGVTFQEDIQPVEGQSIQPDYGNQAASTGLAATPGRPDINPNGIPTWVEWNDPDDTIDYTDVFNSDVNNVMVYAAAYGHSGPEDRSGAEPRDDGARRRLSRRTGRGLFRRHRYARTCLGAGAGVRAKYDRDRAGSALWRLARRRGAGEVRGHLSAKDINHAEQLLIPGRRAAR
jgi:hypothetical protein